MSEKKNWPRDKAKTVKEIVFWRIKRRLTAKERLFPYQNPLIDTLGAKEGNGKINRFLRVKIPAGRRPYKLEVKS